MIRRRAACMLVLATFLVAGMPVAATALPGWIPVDAAFSPTEISFVDLMNVDRSSLGLAPMRGDPALVDIARRHSERMRDAGKVFHNSNLFSEAPGPWSAIAENVGAGTSVQVVHRKFMRSPQHRENILGGFDRVGVGVAVSASGRVYVTQVFVRAG